MAMNMRTFLRFLSALVVVTVIVLPAATAAHFKLIEPASWINSDERGDPQKVGPCGGDPKGDSTDLKADAHDVHAEGLDTGQGPTNAEVILSAAKRGFVGKPYKKVFREYHTVAEDQIEREKIPDGMRFYVRRYFQLIRPRE